MTLPCGKYSQTRYFVDYKIGLRKMKCGSKKTTYASACSKEVFARRNSTAKLSRAFPDDLGEMRRLRVVGVVLR